MHNIKSHKTVEQIAKKHRMDVSDIQKQLDMGEPIEHEHTQDHDLAKDIALQHLDEFPDYYTRLKKMEADAKKEHKKFKDIKEEGIRAWFLSKSVGPKPKRGWVNVVTGGTCASDEPGEGTPKCVSSEKRASMTKVERLSAARRKKSADPKQQEKSGAAAPTYVPTDKPKKKMNKEEVELQEVKDKPGKGSGTKDACYTKVKSRYDVWPSAYASGALVKCRKVGAANWGNKTEAVNIKKKITEETGIRYCPKCKKDETRNACRYGPKYWDMFSLPSKLSDTVTGNQLEYDMNTNDSSTTNEDYEHSMARSELSTIISAAKRLRKKMKGEGNIEAWVQSKITKAADYIDTAADYVDSGEMSEESVSIQDANGNNYTQFIDIIKPNPLKASQGIGSKLLGEAGKKCWTGYKKKGTQKLFGKTYNRCVKESYSNWREDLSQQFNGVQLHEKPGDGYLGPTPIPNPIRLAQDAVDATNRTSQKKVDFVNKTLGRDSASMPKTTYFNPGPSAASQKYLGLKNSYESESELVDEDWQSVNRKDKTDGLSQKAVNAYRSENPGSKLQTAVTEKKPTGKRAQRRKNFCSRMSGMKAKLTSAKTSRDPDSRINKALRRWNCN